MGALRRAPFAQVPGSLRQEMGIARCGHEALSDCCRGGGQTHALNAKTQQISQRKDSASPAASHSSRAAIATFLFVSEVSCWMCSASRTLPAWTHNHRSGDARCGPARHLIERTFS